MDRRTALKASLLAPLLALIPSRLRADNRRTLVVDVLAAPGVEELIQQRLEQYRHDELGIPPLPTGVDGKTYFKAGGLKWPLRSKLFFNGRDVTCLASECDFVGGWAVLFDADAHGNKVMPPRMRVHRGTLEIR
jgi:hypothetical protein